MSKLTIDQLKTTLISHGVELPSSRARKSDYLKLYNEHVVPVELNKSEFSSDEEESNSISIKSNTSNVSFFRILLNFVNSKNIY